MSRIVILGAGESGAGAAVLAKKEGFDVFVSDMSAIKDKYKNLPTKDEEILQNINWEIPESISIFTDYEVLSNSNKSII